MQMTKDLDWVKNQIVVLNVVGSNPTGYPPEVLEIIEFQGLLLYVSTTRPHKGGIKQFQDTRKRERPAPGVPDRPENASSPHCQSDFFAILLSIGSLYWS